MRAGDRALPKQWQIPSSISAIEHYDVSWGKQGTENYDKISQKQMPFRNFEKHQHIPGNLKCCMQVHLQGRPEKGEITSDLLLTLRPCARRK